MSPAVEPEAEALRSSVRSGALWSGAGGILLRFGNVALLSVVARIMTPEEFGVFALALTAHAMAVTLAEFGVTTAVTRSDLDPDRIAPTVCTLALISSLTLAAAMAACAEPLAAALGSPDAAGPLRVLAISVALTGPFAVPGAQLQRDFKQRTIFTANAAAFLPYCIVLIAMSSGGDGAMAFAWSRVIGQVIAGTILILGVDRRYWPGFRKVELGPLLRFGIPLAFANLVAQLLLNVDYVFVGRMLGTEELGYYTIAFNVSVWSTALMGSVISGVALPAFSRVKGEGMPEAVGSALRTVSLISSPIGFFLLAFANPLVITLYGSRWLESAAVLQVLALYGMLSVTCMLLAQVLTAVGRTGILLVSQVTALVFLIPALAAGISLFGLVGTGIAHVAVVGLVTLPVYLVALRRSTSTRAAAVLRAMLPSAAAAATSAAAGWLVAEAFEGALSSLIVGGVVACALYGWLVSPELSRLMPRALGPVTGLLGSMARSRGAAFSWAGRRGDSVT